MEYVQAIFEEISGFLDTNGQLEFSQFCRVMRGNNLPSRNPGGVVSKGDVEEVRDRVSSIESCSDSEDECSSRDRKREKQAQNNTDMHA